MDQTQKPASPWLLRAAGAALAAAVIATAAGGCVYKSEKERVVPSAAPAVPSDRLVSTTDGRWQLYGEGTMASPYYWAWIPAGTSPPPPPPLPKR